MALTDEGIVNIPGMLSRWVRLQSGVKAHYMTSGESGPTVMLLHGGIIGSSGTAGWRFMAPFLGANGFRVYCPDQPGFGLTEDRGGVYEGEAGHVDFLHDFVTALALDRFHLGGNSMGCEDTVNYTTAHPERVVSFALIAGGIGDLAPYDQLLANDTRPESEIPQIENFDGTADSMKRMLTAIIHRKEAISDDLVNMRTMAANNQRETYERFETSRSNPSPNSMSRLSTKGRFDRLDIPGIYLFGMNDVLIPVEACGYPEEDVLPKVQFFYPEETGHQGQTDQPEMFNQVFLEFFRDGRVSRKTADWAGVSKRRPELRQFVAEVDDSSNDLTSISKN
jgi:2-hydroxy-6-oxonona-2,4-dienedioate hydrolase